MIGKVRPLLARLLAAAGCGACLPLGFAPFNWHWTPVVALAGLFFLAAQQGWRKAALIGWAFGLGEFGYGIHWIYIALHIFGEAPVSVGLAMNGLLCAYLAIYPAFVVGLVERWGLWRRWAAWLAVPGLWLLGELLRRSLLWGGFPWFSLGYSALDTPLTRLAPLLGAFGISVVLAWLGFALYRLATAQGRERLLALASLAGPCLLIFLLPAADSWTRSEGDPVSVAMIQAGVPMDMKYDSETLDAQMDNYRDLTLRNLDAQLIVWPETALPLPYHETTDFLDDLNTSLRAHGVTLLFGTVIYEPPDSETARIYASAIATGVSSGRYDKRHLVPFGEFFPIPDFLRPLMDVLGTPYDNIQRGTEHEGNLLLGPNRVDVSICYEDVYGSEFRRDALDSGYLVNLTNDAWYGRSNAAAQHLDFARMRALEYGRPMVRSTGTGYSAFIEADGTLGSRSGLFQLQALRGTVQPRKGSTPYQVWGDAPLWIASALMAFIGWYFRQGGARLPRA